MEVQQGMKHPFDGLYGGANDENGTSNDDNNYKSDEEIFAAGQRVYTKKGLGGKTLLNKTSSSCLM